MNESRFKKGKNCHFSVPQEDLLFFFIIYHFELNVFWVLPFSQTNRNKILFLKFFDSAINNNLKKIMNKAEIMFKSKKHYVVVLMLAVSFVYRL